MKRRNLVAMILLNFFTVGIYGVYWMMTFHKDLRERTGKGAEMWKHALLFFGTIGVYYFVWAYRVSKIIAEEEGEGRDYSLRNVLLGIITLGQASDALIQAQTDNILKREIYVKDYNPDNILEIRNLKKYFPVGKSFFGKPLAYLKAVDDVSFVIPRGSTLGIVGESGCGKTTLGRTILDLQPATDGSIIFNGMDLTKMTPKEIRKLRTQMQIVFQDPYSSLPPRSPVGDIIGEAVKVHHIVPKAEYRRYINDIMQKCGLRDFYFDRFPHEFSGGQRQRICIARALAVNPVFVVCDEPVSALDVSIQAQIVNLFKSLQQENDLTYMFISHDLSVVEHISTHVGVMYLGSMVEMAAKTDLFGNPLHPYTRALLSAVPVPDPHYKSKRIILDGDIPSPVNPPKGCKFHTRCPECMNICTQENPVFADAGDGHLVACHLFDAEYSKDDERYAKYVKPVAAETETAEQKKGRFGKKKKQ